MRRVLAIYNMKSGGRPFRRRLQSLQRLFGECGAEFTAVSISDGLDEDLIRELGPERGANVTAIVGIGGDGTHNAVVNALMRCRRHRAEMHLPPYAIIPFGTGNDLAKSLGLQAGRWHLQQAVDVVLNGRDVAIDLGEWNGCFFADSLSIGVDATVLARRIRIQRRCEGVPLHGYAYYGMATLATLVAPPRTAHADLEIDGNCRYSGPLANLLVNNAPVYGGVFVPTPGGSLEDGALDLAFAPGWGSYVKQSLGAWRYLPWHPANRDRRYRGKRFRVTLKEPLQVQIDGELMAPQEEVVVRVCPGALVVRVPRMVAPVATPLLVPEVKPVVDGVPQPCASTPLPSESAQTAGLGRERTV